MQIAIQIKILPSKLETKIKDDTLTGYIEMVNDVVSDFVDLGKLVPKTSAHIKSTSDTGCPFRVQEVHKGFKDRCQI